LEDDATRAARLTAVGKVRPLRDNAEYDFGMV